VPDAIARQIALLWQTRPLRRERLYVADEVENALAWLRDVFLPRIALRLEQQIRDVAAGVEAGRRALALALAQVGLGFLVFVWGAQLVGAQVMTPVIFVFLIYLLHTTGELCLSPVGLSAMNRLAPSFMASLIMGAWFYMTAVGNFVAGKIGEATGGEGGEMSKELTLAIYSKIGWITIGVSVVVLALSPIVKKWMHLDTLEDDTAKRVAGDRQLGEPQAAGTNLEGETKA